MEEEIKERERLKIGRRDGSRLLGMGT